MSKTNHKITIIDSKGIKTEVPLYTSTKDLKGGHGQPILVNKETLYYPTGAESDPEATRARIKLTNGTTEAILKTGTPEYTQKLITVPSNRAGVSNYTGTFQVPSGVSRLRIALCPSCIWSETEWRDDGEHDYLYTIYHKGTDTTFGNLSAQNNGKTQKNYFVYGCKSSFTFTRKGKNGTKTNFYSITPHDQIEEEAGASYLNYFYTGYMDVQPLQKISYSVGAKSGEKNKPETCGYILIAYGSGVE